MYELASRLHRAYVQHCVGVAKLPGGRTVSVGNWTWGGTGKTPLCMWLAERLGKERTGVLTRGYKGGDEAALMRARGLIVGEGKDRVESARKLAESHGAIDFFVLDDGAQHWRVHRDVEIFSVDCTRFFGRNGWQIPFGTLRESPVSALARAHVVVLHNADLVSEHELNKLVSFCWIHGKSSLQLLFSKFQIRNASVLQTDTHPYWLVFSGIGNNSNFFRQSEKLARSLGKTVLNYKGFLDHHVYSTHDVRVLLDMAERSVAAEKGQKVSFITTEKDIARCPWLGCDSPLDARAIVGDLHLWGDDLPSFERLLLGSAL